MNLSVFGALALVLSAVSLAQADDRTAAAAFYFHSFVKSGCGFNMTAGSAEKAVVTLGMSSPIQDPLLAAVFAICGEVKKGNKSKVIEIRVPDNHKVLRKITLERAKWWQ